MNVAKVIYVGCPRILVVSRHEPDEARGASETRRFATQAAALGLGGFSAEHVVPTTLRAFEEDLDRTADKEFQLTKLRPVEDERLRSRREGLLALRHPLPRRQARRGTVPERDRPAGIAGNAGMGHAFISVPREAADLIPRSILERISV